MVNNHRYALTYPYFLQDEKDIKLPDVPSDSPSESPQLAKPPVNESKPPAITDSDSDSTSDSDSSSVTSSSSSSEDELEVYHSKNHDEELMVRDY